MAKKLANTQFNLTQNTIKYLSCLDLTPSTKLVCIYLTICYNPKNKYVFPKQSTVAEKMGISERTVTRAINELVDKDFCTKKRKPYGSNLYTFTDTFFETIHFIDLKSKRTDVVDYVLWREAIYNKFDGTCQLCSKKGGVMHAHHKKEYANNPEKRYAIDNGILLCEECHKKLHPWM